MSERQKLADWPIVAAALVTLALVPVVLYSIGYFAMGTVADAHLIPVGPTTIRVYDASWKATIYRPAGKVEQYLTGRYVLIGPGIENRLLIPITP